MKGKHIIIILAFVLVLGLLFTSCVRINNKNVSIGKSVYRYDNGGKYSIGNGAVSASKVKNLEIDWVSGDVTVTYGNGDDISFSESFKGDLSEDHLLRWYLDGSTLRIKFQKSGISKGLNEGKNLVVVVPKGFVFDDVDLNCVSSDFICEVEALEYDVDTVSGEIEISASRTRSVDVNSVSGDCTLRMGVCPDEVKMNTVSGSIYILIPSDSGFTAEISTVSGKINCSIPVTTNNKKMVAGNGASKIRLSSVSGSLNISGI